MATVWLPFFVKNYITGKNHIKGLHSIKAVTDQFFLV